MPNAHAVDGTDRSQRVNRAPRSSWGEHLERAQADHYERFSLSDVPSYLDEPAFDGLWRGVQQSAALGARVVVRQFLTRYALSTETEPRLEREPELEAAPRADARSFGYTFVVGSHERR